MAEIQPGRYRHYKGKEYTVLGVARHSETLEELVVYRQGYGERELWVRPAAMFAEQRMLRQEFAPHASHPQPLTCGVGVVLGDEFHDGEEIGLRIRGKSGPVTVRRLAARWQPVVLSSFNR